MITVERRNAGTLSRFALAAWTALLLAACGTDATEPRVASSLAIVSGEEQLVAIAAESEPLVVRVLDQFDASLGGVLVEWAVAAGEGNLSDLSSVTNSDGQAQVTYHAGDTPGEATVTASVAGLESVSFVLTITDEADADEDA